MANFFAELKRRHIYRVAAAYAVLAWLLLQLVNNVAPVLDLPPWVARSFLLLLVIGFPVAMFLAWVRELAPTDGTTARAATSKLDWALIGVLIIVLAVVSYQQLATSPGDRTAQQQSSIASGAPNSDAISLAVLPFVNLSDDRAQEFFSDGMTEEITTALAKVSDLHVVGRTSAFQFKGQNNDLRAIGQALGAGYLIQGSVRKAGDRVRITAQLIKTDNGLNVWAESYDRLLTDVFATQEDIAQAIASALRVPLGLQQGERLVSNRTNDLDSYQQYLRARSLVRARAVDEAVAVLEPVVARDPGFAPAHALFAHANGLVPSYSPAQRSGSLEEARQVAQFSYGKAEVAARAAIRLDPKYPGGYTALAQVQTYRGSWVEAENLSRQALALDRNDPETLDRYSLMLARAGRLKEALSLRAQLRTLEPFVPIFNIFTAEIMRVSGQTQAAIRMLEAVPPNGATGYMRNTYLARAYAAPRRPTHLSRYRLNRHR